jgi:AraC-like DNA-binding protein
MSPAASYTLRTEREVLDRVRELNPDPELSLRDRADLRFVAVGYPGQGALTYPAMAFYAISVRFEAPAFLHEEGWRPGSVCAAAGGVFVQAPNRILEYAWRARHRAWAMCLEPAELARAAEETGLCDPQRIEILSRAGEDGVATRLVQALGVQARLARYPGQQLACAALHKSMALHLLSYGAVPAPHPRRSPKALAPGVLRKAIAYLEDNLDRPCQLDELAAVSGVSSFFISQQFRRAMGETPARYVMRARVERAKHMLLGTRSASRVAAQLGFADSGSFSRLFRRVTGVSPEYFSLLHGRRLDSGPAPYGKPS